MLAEVSQHLDRCFEVHDKALVVPGKPWDQQLTELRLVRIAPSQPLEPTAWLTLGLCMQAGRDPLELLWVDPFGDESVGRRLLQVAEAHRVRGLGLGSVVALDGGWRPGSPLDHVVLTLPYCYGPALARAGEARVCWCVPLHASEARWCEENGLEALESLLEANRADFTDPHRAAVK